MSESLKEKKMKRLFIEWKNVKKRKIALLQKLMRRKKKADIFMKMVCLTKWKMNARGKNLQRMASEILLKHPRK